jgi:DNA-binding FrmR family transcriptional regulator
MKADKNQVSQILKTARGQIDGLLKMVEEDRYCIDISNQILAAEALLKKANRMVLAAHLKGCVRNAMESKEGAEKIDEFISVLEKMER